jgi:hypothetical protein
MSQAAHPRPTAPHRQAVNDSAHLTTQNTDEYQMSESPTIHSDAENDHFRFADNPGTTPLTNASAFPLLILFELSNLFLDG